jgi:hypothetical protein
MLLAQSQNDLAVAPAPTWPLGAKLKVTVTTWRATDLAAFLAKVVSEFSLRQPSAVVWACGAGRQTARTDQVWTAFEAGADITTEPLYLVTGSTDFDLGTVASALVLCMQDLLVHGWVRWTIKLQLAQYATRLVCHVDEHRQHLLHDEYDWTRSHGLRQQNQSTLAQIRTREATVIEEDLRAPIARLSVSFLQLLIKCSSCINRQVALRLYDGYFSASNQLLFWCCWHTHDWRLQLILIALTPANWKYIVGVDGAEEQRAAVAPRRRRLACHLVVKTEPQQPIAANADDRCDTDLAWLHGIYDFELHSSLKLMVVGSCNKGTLWGWFGLALGQIIRPDELRLFQAWYWSQPQAMSRAPAYGENVHRPGMAAQLVLHPVVATAIDGTVIKFYNKELSVDDTYHHCRTDD